MKKILWLLFLVPVLVFARHNGPYPLVGNGGYPFSGGSNAPAIQALPIDFMLNLTSGTVGSLITTGALTSATSVSNTIGAGSWASSIGGTTASSQSTFISNTNLGASIPFLLNGSIVYGSSNYCLLFTNKLPASSFYEVFNWTPSATPIISNIPSLFTARIRFKSIDAGQDLILPEFFSTTAGNGWLSMQGNSAFPPNVGFECHGSTTSGSTYSGIIDTVSESNYFLLGKCDPNYKTSGEAELAILDANNNLVGACQVPSAINGLLSVLQVQNYLSYTGGSNFIGTVTMGIGQNATVPSWIFPSGIPTPNSVTAVEIWTNQVYLTWNQNSIRSELDRSTNGGTTWSVISTNVEAAAGTYSTNTTFNYTDSTVTNGVTYLYRVNANTMEIRSGFSNSPSVAVVAPFNPPTPDIAYWGSTVSLLTWTDTVGSHNATVETGTTLTTGPDGNVDALTSDGIHTIANTASFAMSANKITESIWVNQPSFAANAYIQGDSVSAGGAGADIIQQSPNNLGQVYSGFNGNTSTYLINSYITPNAWHNLLFVFDNSVSTPVITCYVDGQLVSFNPNTTPGSPGNYTTGPWSFFGLPGDSNLAAGSVAFCRVYSGDQSSWAKTIYLSKQ